jgi:hypothetical protein
VTALLLPLLLTLQVAADTLKIGSIERPPPARIVDAASLGAPQVRLRTGQGTAEIWLLRARDTVFLAARIPDSTHYWGDDFVVSLDTRGDGSASPQHDDFQLYFRRVLDSSVVYRGRNGRWEPPRNDPDWRLRNERAGGGWEVSAKDGLRGWTILVRLDPAWFSGESGRWSRIAFRVYDDSPGGWFSWPSPPKAAPATTVERAPSLWAPVR